MPRNLNDRPKPAMPRNVIMLGVVSLCTDAATEMIYPLIPAFVAALGSGVVMLGIIEGVAETTAALLKLFSGIVSDKLGKRKLLVALGYSISSVMRPFTGLVTSAWHIVIVRMLDRVGKGIRTAPRDALIASSVDESIRGRAYGFHRAMDHAGAVIGPLLALLTLGIVIVWGGVRESLPALRWAFCLSIVPGVVAMVTVYFFVEERLDAAPAGTRPGFSIGAFDRNFLTYMALVFLFTLGNSSDAFLLFRVEESVHRSGALWSLAQHVPLLREIEQHMGNTQEQARLLDILLLPVLWAFFHLIKVLLATPIGALSDRIGRKRSINIGWGIYALVYLSFALLDSMPAEWQVPATFVLFTVYSLFYAFSEAPEKAFVADLVAPETRGRAFGLYNFAVGLGALPASIIFGFLYNAFGAAAAFGTGAIIACIAMLLLTLFVREPQKTS